MESSSTDSNILRQRTAQQGPLPGNFAQPLHDAARQTQRAPSPLASSAARASEIAQDQTPVVGRTQGYSRKAQKLVLAKGVFDIFLSLSLVFFPALLYDGPLTKVISLVTTLTKQDWENDTSSAYALASLIMGAGLAGLVAGESRSDDAYKVVAALNGVFAIMGLAGSLLHPHRYGSSFLLLASLQDVFWFLAITTAGPYPMLPTLGLSPAAYQTLKSEADDLAGAAAQRYATDGVKGVVEGTVQGVQSETVRVAGEGRKIVGEGLGAVQQGAAGASAKVKEATGGKVDLQGMAGNVDNKGMASGVDVKGAAREVPGAREFVAKSQD